jgi:hypothetical protein
MGRLIWQMGTAVVLALPLLAALALGKRVYMVQEALVVTLLVAILVAVILLFLVAFVLFQPVVRRSVRWMTNGMARLVRLGHHQVSTSDPIVPPPFQR